MQIILIRHAPAQAQAQADELRPLSEQGIIKMRHNIIGLKKNVPSIQTIAHSPLQRAQQTAELLISAYPKAHQETLPALAPGGLSMAVLAYLQEQAETTLTMALVGHEPDLGELATWLLTGHRAHWLPLKKGGACLLAFWGKIEVGQAQLCWLLKPRQLRSF